MDDGAKPKGLNITRSEVSTQAHLLISGATSGVGTAIAQRLAAERPLLLHGRDSEKLQSLVASLPTGYPHETWIYDLRDINGLNASLEAKLQHSGISVGAFVHCAGIAVVLPARGAPLATTQESLNINFLAAQQLVGSLLKRRHNPAALADVIFISSIYSQVGVRGHSIYCATKAALDGLMRALAVELAPGTRVNSILPGALATKMASEALENAEIRAHLQKSYPLGIGRPEDVAEAAHFILSSGARWLTGQEIVLDGGRTVNFSLK